MLYTNFMGSGKKELQAKLGKKNLHQVPVLTKVIVAMGIGSLASRKGAKDFSDLESNLKDMTGQKPHIILSKKAISNFKLRVGMPVMLRVTLRGRKAYDFLERVTSYVLPRIRDFNGLSPKKFDGMGNYHVGLKQQTLFPEIAPEQVTIPMGVQISIATSATTDSDAKALLESLGCIFVK